MASERRRDDGSKDFNLQRWDGLFGLGHPFQTQLLSSDDIDIDWGVGFWTIDLCLLPTQPDYWALSSDWPELLQSGHSENQIEWPVSAIIYNSSELCVVTGEATRKYQALRAVADP